jgi:hypothetical protein
MRRGKIEKRENIIFLREEIRERNRNRLRGGGGIKKERDRERYRGGKKIILGREEMRERRDGGRNRSTLQIWAT